MAEVGRTRGYKSQCRRWELLMVDRSKYNMLQLCSAIRCRNGDGGGLVEVGSAVFGWGKGLGGRQVVSDRELASPCHLESC